MWGVCVCSCGVCMCGVYYVCGICDVHMVCYVCMCGVCVCIMCKLCVVCVVYGCGTCSIVCI